MRKKGTLTTGVEALGGLRQRTPSFLTRGPHPPLSASLWPPRPLCPRHTQPTHPSLPLPPGTSSLSQVPLLPTLLTSPSRTHPFPWSSVFKAQALLPRQRQPLVFHLNSPDNRRLSEAGRTVTEGDSEKVLYFSSLKKMLSLATPFLWSGAEGGKKW